MPAERFFTGQTFRATLLLDEALVAQFAALSGDTNPVHVDHHAARTFGYARPVAHGALLVGVLSRLIGTEIPGPGAIWMEQNIRWVRPVFVGDTVTVEVSVSAISVGAGVLQLSTSGLNQHGELVMEGTAKVKATAPMPGQAPVLAATTALVTGGGRGIGAAIAIRLAKAGLDVAITYHRDKGSAEAVSEVARAFDRRCSIHESDLGQAGSGERLQRSILEIHGQIDIVVHAAAPRIIAKAVTELSRTDFEEQWAVGLGAAIDLVRLWSPGMAERKYGRFVFIGTSALHGAPTKGWAPYLATKHALRGFMRSVANELGPVGVTCNVVSPGLTVTDLTNQIPARFKEVEARKNPMRRLASPDDTAAVVTFLVGPDAGFINGAEVPVDGGSP